MAEICHVSLFLTKPSGNYFSPAQRAYVITISTSITFGPAFTVYLPPSILRVRTTQTCSWSPGCLISFREVVPPTSPTSSDHLPVRGVYFPRRFSWFPIAFVYIIFKSSASPRKEKVFSFSFQSQNISFRH